MKLSDQVKTILREHPATRSDDKKLIVALWWQFNNTSFKKHEGEYLVNVKDIVYKFPTPESITRCRRKIQEEGMYLADKGTQEQRKDRDDNIRGSINGYNWEENF